eukprot:TRINITY_DN4421_c1_g1_i1.p1 TRINITY_DN4421_c1_g1~~TRINITY_DN4421_c1_g1_i1.p1  ORF type:complete len:460 (+),score=62.68 TRINITY_DN4421_c1_g1_i1:64-1443(+)
MMPALSPTVSSELRAQVDSLPDLTERIIDLGLHGEYMRFRAGYVAWRQGGTAGARGEHTAEGLVQAQERAGEIWYPNFTTWRWRRSISYFIAVSLFEGSLIFFITGCLSFFPPREHGAYLVAWPSFIGGSMFSVSAYLMCYEAMNLKVEDGHSYRWPFAWQKTVERLDALGDGVSRRPYCIGLTFLIGATVYTISLVAGFYSDLDLGAKRLFIALPNTIGGFFFVWSAFIECVENKSFHSWPRNISMWSSWGNFVGSNLFLLYGLACFFPHLDFWANMMFTVGSGVFVMTSVMAFLLWKDEQFGLTYLSALNHFAKNGQAYSFANGSGEDNSAGFSVRGLLFLIFYSFVAVLAVFNTFTALEAVLASPELLRVCTAINDLLPFVLLHMVILMHAAVIKTPKTQPYHFLVMLSRVAALLIGANSACIFVAHTLRDYQAFPDDLPVQAAHGHLSTRAELIL